MTAFFAAGLRELIFSVFGAGERPSWMPPRICDEINRIGRRVTSRPVFDSQSAMEDETDQDAQQQRLMLLKHSDRPTSFQEMPDNKEMG
ncbi:hypothetical protein ACDY96_28050 [Rhizobium mongolense]|uniref:hypothetical protein n=1 Tax=Rhizobium mongolense TaxID=57676 RepID=UPI003557B88A